MDSATARLWAKRDVFVHGEDISGVTLTLQPCLTLSGRIVFESAATTVAPPSSSAIRLRLRDARKTPLTSVDLSIMPNGTFTTASVVPGRYQIALVAPRPVSQAAGGEAGTWSIRSVTMKGLDVTDLTFTIAETDNIDDVVVTLTDRATELAGTLVDAAGAPVAGYRIVAFSTNPGHWYQGGRRLPAPVQSAADGTYRFTGLPAGTYHIAALREVDRRSSLTTRCCPLSRGPRSPLRCRTGERRSRVCGWRGGGAGRPAPPVSERLEVHAEHELPAAGAAGCRL